MSEGFIIGFGLVLGVSVGVGLVMALVWAGIVLWNVFLRYGQAAWPENGIQRGPGYHWRRVRWALNAVRQWGAIL